MTAANEIEKLPEGWRRVKLGEIVTPFTGQSKSKYVTSFGNYFIVDMGAISTDGKLIASKRTNYDKDFLEYGDLVMPKDDIGGGNIIGKVAFIDKNNKYILGDHVFRLKVNRGYSLFVYYMINSHPINSNLRRKTTGTAQLGLNRKSVEEQEIFFPPLPEQRKIAEILETVDNAIEKTDKIIEKYKRIKQALMQDLLTKGIDENGQIRSEEMHRFKDSPLGRIPEEWKVVELGEIFNISAGGDIDKLNFSYDKSNTFKYPIYSNTLEDKGLYGYADSYRFPENSITITARGVLGIAIPRFEKFNAIIRLLVLIPKDKVNITFVSEYINTFVNFYIEETGVPQLTAPKASDRLISLPSLPEQQRIASILSQIDEAIEKEQKCKEKLERIKQGLMQDLLTGKVRVNHLISKEVKV